MVIRKTTVSAVRTFLLLLLVWAVAVTGVPTFAMAQQVQRKPTLLQWLFGGQQRRQPDIIELPARKKTRNKKRTSNSVTTLTTSPTAVAKNPDARRVLVVGDFLASGLAEGLQSAFEQDASTVIEGRANTASGLVRDDYFNWPEKLAGYVAEVHPTVVVVLIGANDRQQMRIEGSKEKYDSPAWNEAYKVRVNTVLKIARDAGASVVWVGLPAFKSSNTSAAALQFNTIYRNETARSGAEFVDIWDGFVDENGKFILTGSDINGQPMRLRTSDGVGMTAAGKRKVAFYAEKPVRKLLGEPQEAEKLVRLNSDSLLPQTGPDKPVAAGPITRTPPISLTDPELDGGTALLGGPQAKIITTGSVLPGKSPAPKGRVDNYSLPAL